MMTPLAFEEAALRAKTLIQLNEALKQYLAGFEIELYAFTFYSVYPNAFHKVRYSLASEKQQAWHQYYISEGFEDADSTLGEVYHMTSPIFWDIRLQYKNATTEREREMRRASLDYGTECGISIPVHGPSEEFSVFMLAQSQGTTSMKHWREKQYEWTSVGYLYYHHLKRFLLRVPPDAMAGLTDRAVQCLRLVAKGYSLREIAKQLNITERTVNFHIQKMNKALGAKNKYHAVVKALEKGILSITTRALD